MCVCVVTNQQTWFSRVSDVKHVTCPTVTDCASACVNSTLPVHFASGVISGTRNDAAGTPELSSHRRLNDVMIVGFKNAQKHVCFRTRYQIMITNKKNV